jgi:transketolase
VEALTREAERDPRLIVMTADLGYSVFEGFEQRFPQRYLKLGIVEAAMVGIAAGFALGGFRPLVYTIATFASMRCFEQIRNDVCYQGLPVKIVGAGGGLSYGTLAGTHHSLEDLALMRALPGMTVLCPADPVETRWATEAAVRHPGPVYLRLGKKGEKCLHAEGAELEMGRAALLREGSDATILGCGPVLEQALEAAERLQEKGLGVRVASLHTVKPLDHEFVLRCARDTRCLVTLEEHNVIGGLGSAVADVLALGGVATRFARLGVPDLFVHQVGSQEWLRRQFGLEAESIAARIERLLGSSRDKEKA